MAAVISASPKAVMMISRSNSLLTLKCELLVQMTKQSYASLFTLTIGFIPISIKRLLCNFDCTPTSRVENCHRKLVLSRDHFSNYLEEHDVEVFFLQTALLKFILYHDKRIKVSVVLKS